jgi:hypothetical protein
MSLINDALKRAKQAQKNRPPTGTSGPQFRPAEPTPRKSSNLNWFLPLAIFIVMALIILFVWSQSHKNDSRAIAQKPAVVNQPSPAASPPATALQTPAIPGKLIEPAPAPKPAGPMPSVATPTAPPVTTATAIAAQTSAPVAVPVAAPAPKPAPPRLQAIFYNPQHPSVIIDGKTVMIGDKLGEFRVRAITQDSATLTSAAQTIVLTLE